jgi:hypothetical protein
LVCGAGGARHAALARSYGTFGASVAKLAQLRPAVMTALAPVVRRC